MAHFITFIISALQITLLNIVLSGDNIGAIALVVRSLNPEDAKKASIIGICAAILFRIFFASVVTSLMSLEWLPLKLIGGVILLLITRTLIKDGYGDTRKDNTDKPASFLGAVIKILLTDISMSFDNVLAIGGAAHGSIGLIAIGVALTVPVILLGSNIVVSLMEKYRIAVYIGGAVLIHTSTAMILSSWPLALLIGKGPGIVIPWVASAFLLKYGIIRTREGGRV